MLEGEEGLFEVLLVERVGFFELLDEGFVVGELLVERVCVIFVYFFYFLIEVSLFGP